VRERAKVMIEIERERERLLERLSDLGVTGGERYSYYQGRIDALNWALNQLLERERV
jgi:predicted nucleotidyltransferase